MIRLPYKKLVIWNKAMQLAKKIFIATHDFPKIGQLALSNQLRRSAVSVPSNIAEGSQRSTDKDFVRFLRIAKGSLAELETQVILAVDFGYIQEIAILQEIDVLSKMLYSLISTISLR